MVALEPGITVPEGKLEGRIAEMPFRGATARHTIVWRDPAKPGLPWSDNFPAGYACGKCVPAGSGVSYDMFD